LEKNKQQEPPPWTKFTVGHAHGETFAVAKTSFHQVYCQLWLITSGFPESPCSVLHSFDVCFFFQLFQNIFARHYERKQIRQDFLIVGLWSAGAKEMAPCDSEAGQFSRKMEMPPALFMPIERINKFAIYF